MMVKTGWNTDFGKEKFDVGLGEEDLARILADAGIPPDAQVRELEAFHLLRLTAEQYSRAQYARVSPGAAEDCKLDVKRCTEQRAAILGGIKDRLGVE